MGREGGLTLVRETRCFASLNDEMVGGGMCVGDGEGEEEEEE